MRIDVCLAEKGLASSRTEAKKYIDAGAVTVGGVTVLKPSFDVDAERDVIEVDKSALKYVSRGGLKLERALSEFGVEPRGRLCVDIGASSGGFTDCLLQNGAMHVIALDSGRSQLVEKIAKDERVTSKEGFNARYMTKEDLGYSPTLAVMDVSFISATYIIGAVYECLSCGSDFICLIKPQFEVGRANIGKGGIVKDKGARDGAVKKVVDFALSLGFLNRGLIESPIKGGDGNVEYLAHFVKP